MEKKITCPCPHPQCAKQHTTHHSISMRRAKQNRFTHLRFPLFAPICFHLNLFFFLFIFSAQFQIPKRLFLHKPLTLHSKASFHPNTHAPQQDLASHDPDANSSSLSKNCVWVNPNSPRAKHLQTKSHSARYSYLARLTESLNSCTPSAQHVSTILKGLRDNVSERDSVFILDKMTNPDTAPFVLSHFRFSY
ncbi:hypothetical protein AAZX31_15G113100 [Glycine max]